MLSHLLYITAGTLLCSVIEFVRWKITYGKKENLGHPFSVVICIGVMVVVYFWHPFPISLQQIWWSLFRILLFSGGVVSLRLILYAPVLNLLAGHFVEYMSKRSSSKVDAWIQAFWVQRAIGAGGIIFYSLLNLLL